MQSEIVQSDWYACIEDADCNEQVQFAVAIQLPRNSSMNKPNQAATILVVDPSPISLTAVAGVLDTQGYECYCARTAEAAEKAIESAPVDLVVWDVADDAADAMTQIEALRTSHGAKIAEVPFILLADSCWAGLETRIDIISPARCLFKPLDPNTLIDLVQQALWVPHIIRGHHLGKKKANRPGWITL